MRPLVWFGPVLEPTGYSDEVRGMSMALDTDGVPVCLRNSTPESPGFRESLDASQRTALQRCLTRPIEGPFIQVQHGTVDGFRTPDPSALYSVGRSMLETDGMPSHWVSGANALDELWVTGAFNQSTFRAAGVRVPMFIVPGGIDGRFFRPGIEPLRVDGVRGTVFLSVFEWRLRKGWDVLLRAWADAFTPDDDVTLVVRTYPVGKVDGQRNNDVINARIDAFLRDQCGGRSRADVAPIVILGDRVAGRDLPALYSMANAFVLPTRGEGWGRPFMESMACGVPVIATNWSAHLAFMHDDNSYLVDVDRLVPADAVEMPLYAGQQWAEPSATHLTSQLRRVHGDRGEARAIGERARLDMVTEWPWSRASDAITARLREIDGSLDRVLVASAAPHTSGVVVEGGNGDPTRRASNAFVWLDALLRGASAPDHESCAVSWHTTQRGARPSYGSPAYAAWQRANARVERAVVHVTVLDDAANSPPAQPAHGVWVIDVGSVVTESVPGHLVTVLRDQADRVVVPHAAARDACLAAGVEDQRLIVMAPAVDTTRFAPSGAAYRRRAPGGTRFLLVGGDRAHRALQRTIAVFDRTFSSRDDVTLHVVLPPPRAGEDTAWRERVIAEAAAARRHPLLPRLWIDSAPIHADEMPALYRAADVLIHAGSATGRGLTIREAMACGVPVIATDVEPARSLIDAQSGWLVPRGPGGVADPSALQAALQEAQREVAGATSGSARAEHARRRALSWPPVEAQRIRLRECVDALHTAVPRRITGDAVPDTATPFPLENPRPVVILVHADWHNGAAPAVVRAYAMACRAADDVTLALCLDPAQGVSVDDATRLVHQAMQAAHCGDDQRPDLLLVPDVLDAPTMHRLRAAADLVVAVRDPVAVATARRARCDVLESLDVASWRSAIARCLASLHAA